jgi:DNA-binding SARP family transcriptional activator
MNEQEGAIVGGESALEREVFARFPYSLLIVDSNGRVICNNHAATPLIEASGLLDAELTCCALLGCRSEGGALASACVTEIALRHNRALPELHVQLETPSGVGFVWLAAAPLGSDGDRVLLQLRPGVDGEARGGTDYSDWADSGRLRIETLGGTAVYAPDGALQGEWLQQRTGQLLQYLVARRDRAVTVEEIGESLWPGCDYSIAGNVRYYVHTLRRRLEPQLTARAPSKYVCSRAGSYRLNLEHIEIDVDAFERDVLAGLAMVGGDPLPAADRLERGLALYRGDFLAELRYAEWAISERERLHDLACLALRTLARIRREHSQIDRAAQCLERIAVMQPYDEDVFRELMALDIVRGRRSHAVRRYAALSLRMNRAFGHDPSFTPAELVGELV